MPHEYSNGKMAEIIAEMLKQINDALRRSNDPKFADDLMGQVDYWTQEQIRLTGGALIKSEAKYRAAAGIRDATKQLKDIQANVKSQTGRLDVANQIVGAVTKLLNALK